MNILIVGRETHLQEARQKFGEEHRYCVTANPAEADQLIHECDVVFDFIVDCPTERYTDTTKIVFLNTSFISLSQLGVKGGMFGFCGMPTFLNRPVFEVSVGSGSGVPGSEFRVPSSGFRVSGLDDRVALEGVCAKLKTPYEIVADRVGLVTPRIISMIINEAYRSLEDGTATRADIDSAMKLGTNYPYGPFEWCELIGRKDVIQLLDAVYQDTQDERYRVCPLLRNER
jgi:3-hydroxybutyryl-CoA dehydrogenase